MKATPLRLTETKLSVVINEGHVYCFVNQVKGTYHIVELCQ